MGFDSGSRTIVPFPEYRSFTQNAPSSCPNSRWVLDTERLESAIRTN